MRQRDVIGRGVRIREATLQVASLDDLDEIFRVLERTFAQDQFARSEVRLRRTFIVSGGQRSDRRTEDEFTVWSWTRNVPAAPDSWEIRLPLLADEGARIGSLVLWQQGQGSDTALSHFHTIAGALRSEVERKIRELWRVTHPPAAEVAVEIPSVAAGIPDDVSLVGSPADAATPSTEPAIPGVSEPGAPRERRVASQLRAG
jgi:hypothetical protein